MFRALFALAFLGGLAVADDKKPADKLAALKKEADDAQAAYRKAATDLDAQAAQRKAATDVKEDADINKKYQELFKVFDKGQGERFAAAVELAKADPKADVAVEALEWVLVTPRSYYLPAGVAAMDEVVKNHAASPKVGKLVGMVGYYAPFEKFNPKEAAAATALIDAVAKANPDKTVRAQAVLAQAYAKKQKYDAAAYEKSADAEKLAVAAEDAYEAVIKEYGDAPRLHRAKAGTVGEFAKQELFELRNLRVGKVAPDIEADAVGGSRFKLSDHRGKVVAVVFWASWCGPCMADVPHEREMAERLKGKPFTIVGINGDDKRETASEVMAKEKMTWPSFWNGTGGPDGPISKAWNVRGWPTVYVLDAKGVIRFKGPRGKQLEESVNTLLDEMGKK